MNMLARAFISHMYRYHPPLPHPTHFGVFHSIREVTLLFCNLVKFLQRPLYKELRYRDLPVVGLLCCTFIEPTQSERAVNGVFTFILFLVSSGPVSIK